MSSSPVKIDTPVLILKVISGPDKGTSYKVLSDRITIGRDEGNDIVLSDQRCSRHHAAMIIESNQVIATDIGSRSGIFVDGKRHTETVLPMGHPFQIGDTVLSFQWSNNRDAEASSQLDIVKSHQLSSPSSPQARTNRKGSFYVIVGIVFLVLAALILNDSTNKSSDYGLRTEDQIDEEISNTQKRKEDLFREKMAQGVFNTQANEAQAAYIQGFRDFREGNFSRSIQSFTAALALNPDHQLAIKYKRLAEQRLDELVHYHMMDGKRYYEQNKFELARSSYRNVLILINDQNNKIYIEAKERLQEIELLLKGRY